MVVAAGLLADGVQNLQELRRAAGRLDDPLEHERERFPMTPGIGDVLHGLVGYSAAPTVAPGGPLGWPSSPSGSPSSCGPAASARRRSALGSCRRRVTSPRCRGAGLHGWHSVR